MIINIFLGVSLYPTIEYGQRADWLDNYCRAYTQYNNNNSIIIIRAVHVAESIVIVIILCLILIEK